MLLAHGKLVSEQQLQDTIVRKPRAAVQRMVVDWPPGDHQPRGAHLDRDRHRQVPWFVAPARRFAP